MFRVNWRTVAKAVAGLAAGLALWIALSPLYTRAVAASAQWTLRLFEDPPVTRLRPAAEENYVSVDRADFDPRSKRPALPVHDLTFNVILMTALFAASRRTFSDRNILGFVIASVLLYLTHVFALVTSVMSVYVLQLGLWSRVNYGDVSRNIWSVLNHGYRVVGMYAIAFGLWWLFRGPDDPAAPAPKKRKRR